MFWWRGQSLRSEDLSNEKTAVEEVKDCSTVWDRAKVVCSAINRLEKSGILLPEPVVPLVRHFATCEICKREFAYMHKRCSFVLQDCEHGDGFLSAKGCAHITGTNEGSTK